MENRITPVGKDSQLWEIAHQRASFKRHLFTYLIMTVFFWVVWYLSGGYDVNSFPWPVWPMIGWGIGIAFHYVNAYVLPKSNATEREYEKLIKEQQSKQNI